MPETAIPVGVGQLRIALARFADQIQYEDQPACSREDLLVRLNTFRPHILHVSGHGDTSGAVALMHPDSSLPSRLLPSELSRLLAGRTELRLLVLDCCHSGAGATALRHVVPAMIATGGAIREPYPIVFASALYHSIASGRSLEASFHDAVVASAERAEGSTGFDLWISEADPGVLVPCQSASQGVDRSCAWRPWPVAAGLVLGACLGVLAPEWMLPSAKLGSAAFSAMRSESESVPRSRPSQPPPVSPARRPHRESSKHIAGDGLDPGGSARVRDLAVTPDAVYLRLSE